jgi:hypothetical protein
MVDRELTHSCRLAAASLDSVEGLKANIGETVTSQKERG